jgi:hypothetical protein
MRKFKLSNLARKEHESLGREFRQRVEADLITPTYRAQKARQDKHVAAESFGKFVEVEISRLASVARG